MDYFEKIEQKPKEDLSWNIPERKQGSVNVIGGNAQSFKTEIKISEFLAEKYPIERIKTVLPDTLKTKLPNLENFSFLPATETGSFKESQALIDIFNEADFNLLIGDLSKNKITAKALASAIKNTEKMTLITRDAVDLVAEVMSEKLLMNENLIFFASVAQLIKILRAVYYPKMLLMSQSLIQVADVLHKFTLSYPVAIITLHNEQILIAKNGNVRAISLEKSGFSPMMIWNGQLAGKVTALNLYNPNNFLAATVGAVLW